jgi:hypothetical protein
MNYNKKYHNDTLCQHILDVENQNVKTSLNDSLIEIYEIIRKNCESFKNDIFNKKLDNLELNLVFICLT